MSVKEVVPCPQCNRVPNKQNRLITERCGHKKCRLCFLYDEADCLQCMRRLDVGTEFALPEKHSMDEIPGTKPMNNLEDVVKVANVINNETETRKRKMTSACANLTPSHIHFQQTPDGFTEFHCTVCKKYFSRSEQYYHLACANDDNKKYRCKVCEKKFSSRSHLNYHMESHEINIYKCKVCAKTFDKLAILQKHEKHHSALAVNCPECNKVFQHLVSMEAHLAKHKNELRFSCSQCENKYATNSLLQQHMLKHSEKKHQCNQCGQRFQRNSSLTLHTKRHSETESFICSICKKRFKDLGTLLRHKDTHAGTMKFKCTECDLKSMRRDTILRHARVNHDKNPKDCVEVLKIIIPQPSPPLNLTTVQTLEEQFSELSCEENHMELDPPVTVENSVVIKRVGNVPPVAVPILSCSSQASSFIDVLTVTETNILVPMKNQVNCLQSDNNNYNANDYVKQTESNNVSDFENASATTYIDIETLSPTINESYIKTYTKADNLLDDQTVNPALGIAENLIHIGAGSPDTSTTLSAIETEFIAPAISSVIKESYKATNKETVNFTNIETSRLANMGTVRLINMEMGNSNIESISATSMDSFDKTNILGIAEIKTFPILPTTKRKTLQVSNMDIAEAPEVGTAKERGKETVNVINIAPIIDTSVTLSTPKNYTASAAKNEIIENSTSSGLTWTTLQNIDTNTYATILHKKLRKKYDPIEMYRKILNDAEEATQKQLRENNLAQEIVSPESVKPVAVQQRSQSNFTETHWRKNYKYTYKFQDY